MAYNGSGTFSINSTGQPVVSGTTISDTVFNALTADLATGLTNCITRDGQSPATANIPMGGNKLTGLASGTAATDASTLAQVQSGAVQFFTAGGTADVITGTLSPAISAYAAGQTFRFVASGANTGAVTLNLNSLGAKAVTKNGTTALAAGDIPSGKVVTVTYDGTQFQLVEKIASTFTPSGSITASGYTQSTSRLLGRTTASTGAIEELTVGNGLSLSSGALTATTSADPAVVIGYGTGSGGTVTQSTSRTTAVTLNKPTGQITMFTAAGTSTWQSFTVNNTLVTANDVVAVSLNTATNFYSFTTRAQSGSFQVWFAAVSGTASDTPVINFTVIKGAIA